MNKAMLLVVPLLVVAPARAWGAEKGDSPAKADKGGAGATKKADADKKKPEKGGAAAKAEPPMSEAAKKRAALKAKKEEPPANNPQRSATLRAKSVFLFAMETCDRPDRCDPTLRDDAERKFLDACRVCAPPEKCEAERDAIRGGTAARRTTPCDPEK